MNKSSYDKEKSSKSNKITLTRQIHPHILQINPVKHKSFRFKKKISNTLAKKHNDFKFEKSEQNSKTNKIIVTHHRPTISTDFSLSLEFGSLINTNKHKEYSNSNINLKNNKNRLIKVNTKRNNYIQALSLRNQTKANQKSEKNNKNINIEKNELFQNISEINIFQNLCQNKQRVIKEFNLEKYKYDIKKIIYIQKWWKNLYMKNKSEYYMIMFLVESIKKIFLLISFNSIKNTFPTINYFFHKWYGKMIKRIILKQILNNGYQIQKTKNYQKEKNNMNINKLSEKKSTPKLNPYLHNDFKRNNKDKNMLSNKKRFISISINTDNSKKKDKNNYCQTSKHNNNKINFNLNYLNNINNKKSILYSPKATFKSERFSSPINNLKQNIESKKKSLSKILKKNHSKLFKNENSKINNNEKKQIQIKSKKVMNKTNNRKNNKNQNGENIIQQKKNSNLDNIISNNNSKNDAKYKYEESNSVLIQNTISQYNNYILNFNKKDNAHTAHRNKNRGVNKENKSKSKIIDENYNSLINNKTNNKSLYYNTEANCNIINNLFKYKESNSNSKIYENCLYRNQKYKIFCSPERNDLSIGLNNNNNDNIIKKKSDNIPISKYIILHKKEKERKKIINKEFSNHKKNIKYITSANNSHTPIIKATPTYSRTSSNENNSIKGNKRYIKNLGVSIYFYYWKEYIDKKIIIQNLTKFPKFIKHINNYKKILLIKDFIQKLVRKGKREKVHRYIMKMVYKMIINIMNKINEYKKHNMKEIKIFKKNNYNNIYTHFHREKGDIINNININNYIHYELVKKRKTRSPGLISKVIEFKTVNTNTNKDNNNQRLSLAISNSDKILDFSKLNKNKRDNNNNKVEEISINIFNQNENNNNNDIIKNDYTRYLSSKNLNNKKMNIKKEENGVIIDQINQLKMVINLLERHNCKSNISSYTLVDYFNKWKSISIEKNTSLMGKIKTPTINEKIINLKPFQTTKRLMSTNSDCLGINPIDMSMKKNLSINKMSPKIINVINVQNFNENNNYNYNFKYMPIKDIPICSNKNRHTYVYDNNIKNINTDYNNIVNNNINENRINITNNNNNLNVSSILMGNEYKRTNSNIVYQKKKLGSTPINNNCHFNFNNNIDNINNKTNINNWNYNIDNKKNYDNSSLLFMDHNLSQIMLQDFPNRIYNLKDMSMNTVIPQTENKDNSYNDLGTCKYQDQYPEQKFGFKKLNQIEEKEINFENINNNKNNTKLYIKKQYFEPRRTRVDTNYQNNIKTNLFEKDEDINNNNLIKCLNVQFAKTSNETFKKDKINNNKNNNIYDENDNCITISEDNFDRTKFNDKKGVKHTYDDINDDNMIDSENNENLNKRAKKTNLFNKIFSCKYLRNEFSFMEDINDKKINNSFVIYPKNYEEFKMLNIFNSNITL